MQYALIIGGVVRECWPERPVLVAALMRMVDEVPDEVRPGWSSDGQGGYAPPDLPGMFETWDAAAGAYVPDVDALAGAIRAERDRRIGAVRWRIERARDQNEQGVAPDESIAPLLDYVQALRDLPQLDGFPWSGLDAVNWPTPPPDGAD